LDALIDSVIQSMMFIDIDPTPNCDPDSEEFRDHFYMELVLRLTRDVPFSTTASFLATAIGEASAPDVVAPADMPDAATQKRYNTLEKALYAFVKAEIRAERSKAAQS
jgi:hypothetical protein